MRREAIKLIKVKHSHIYIPYRQMTERLVPIVRERVLHITCTSNLQSILADGKVSGNANGRLSSSFGSSSNGFFRCRNAVSVFDYRSVPDDKFEDAWSKCSPLTALRNCNFKIALLFLAQESYEHLINWRRWHDDQSYEQMLVPYVEAGYSAPMPLSAIDEILEIRTRYYPSRLERLFEDTWRKI